MSETTDSCNHQFHSDYVVDWFALPLYDRQLQARYVHTCLLCGEKRATDKLGDLYWRVNEKLWELVNADGELS